jgi:hypothetical protein
MLEYRDQVVNQISCGPCAQAMNTASKYLSQHAFFLKSCHEYVGYERHDTAAAPLTCQQNSLWSTYNAVLM